MEAVIPRPRPEAMGLAAGRLGPARRRSQAAPAKPGDGRYLDEEATASVRWIFSAADSISSTTASG
jgi:hypothetical protein